MIEPRTEPDDELLRDLIGVQVDVWSTYGTSEHSDRGTLEACSERWLRIRTAEGVILCFHTDKVRLVKGRSRPPGPAALPIPAKGEPPAG
jgi:hypothetical protein